MKFSPLQGIVISILAIGAGLVAGYAYWHNQDVWTVGENGWATLVAGFTASTTGALAGVTAALFSLNTDGGARPAGRATARALLAGVGAPGWPGSPRRTR
jgi:hypothetical protein